MRRSSIYLSLLALLLCVAAPLPAVAQPKKQPHTGPKKSATDPCNDPGAKQVAQVSQAGQAVYELLDKVQKRGSRKGNTAPPATDVSDKLNKAHAVYRKAEIKAVEKYRDACTGKGKGAAAKEKAAKALAKLRADFIKTLDEIKAELVKIDKKGANAPLVKNPPTKGPPPKNPPAKAKVPPIKKTK